MTGVQTCALPISLMSSLYRCVDCARPIPEGLGLCDTCQEVVSLQLAEDRAWEISCGMDGAAAARADFLHSQERGEVDYWG